jgi:hypothetical protein
MRTVMFTFRPEVSPEQQDAILDQLDGWEEIRKAVRLKPDAKYPEILRMCYAYLEDSADVESTAKRMADLPEVEAAEIPAKRGLLATCL